MSILVLTSDTLSSPAVVGQIEYASPIFTGTPIGTQRGIVPTQQYYRLDSAFVGANVTTAQSIFGVGVTLSASTVYEFEIVALFTKTAGGTSHTFSVLFGGAATINNILFYATNNPSTTAAAPQSFSSQGTFGVIQVATTSTLATGIASATLYQPTILKGTVSINAGGTFIPQYILSAAPGGAYSTAAGSYIRINPLSASGAATNVGTWS